MKHEHQSNTIYKLMTYEESQFVLDVGFNLMLLWRGEYKARGLH